MLRRLMYNMYVNITQLIPYAECNVFKVETCIPTIVNNYLS